MWHCAEGMCEGVVVNVHLHVCMSWTDKLTAFHVFHVRRGNLANRMSRDLHLAIDDF